MNRLLVAVFMLATASAANATLIPFQFTGGSLTATGAFGVSSYSANAGSASLDDGISAPFVFGTVTAFAIGSGQLTVNVDFVSPISGTQGVSGPYSVVATFFYNNGSWSGGTSTFSYDYMGNVGSALLSMNPIASQTFLTWPTFTFAGSIKNLGSSPTALVTPTPVPEPASIALLGGGLLALGVLRRRKAG